MSEIPDLKPGDVVRVGSIKRTGTVITTNPPKRGLSGVTVRLHNATGEVETCFATFAECERITRSTDGDR